MLRTGKVSRGEFHLRMLQLSSLTNRPNRAVRVRCCCLCGGLDPANDSDDDDDEAHLFLSRLNWFLLLVPDNDDDDSNRSDESGNQASTTDSQQLVSDVREVRRLRLHTSSSVEQCGARCSSGSSPAATIREAA